MSIRFQVRSAALLVGLSVVPVAARAADVPKGEVTKYTFEGSKG
jgi:hypothetical protein